MLSQMFVVQTYAWIVCACVQIIQKKINNFLSLLADWLATT